VPRAGIRILVGIDFSRESIAALRAARALAKKTGGRVTIAHVRPSSDLRAAVMEDRGDLLRGKRDLSATLEDHYARRLARKCRPASGERILVLRGNPGEALCRTASRGYDLLAVGTRGRGGVAAFLLGSTVQEILVKSRIPVMVVRR